VNIVIREETSGSNSFGSFKFFESVPELRYLLEKFRLNRLEHRHIQDKYTPKLMARTCEVRYASEPSWVSLGEVS